MIEDEFAKYHDQAAGDVDGDGRQEVVAGPNVWRRAAGRWERQRIADFKDPVVALGDLTGNGRADIVLAEGESYPARLAWFEAPDYKMHLLAEDLFHPHSLAAADFDGDGRLDIMVGEMGLGQNPHPRLMIYLNKAGGAFEPVAIDHGHATHHARVIHLEGHRLPSIVGKPYRPGNQVDLWTNVTL